jgi:tetratricopeptide (TPR) repeat protein
MSDITMMTMSGSIDELRERALVHVRAGEYESALAIYDEALQLDCDETTRELLTINKADAMIALDRTGPEVQALPMILMKRRNLHHTFLAAYALMFKHRVVNECKRALFYGQIARDAAEQADEPFWKIAVLNDLGIAYEMDSQFVPAIDCLEGALALIDAIPAGTQQSFSRIAILTNLGYNRMLIGEVAEGIRLIESVIDHIEAPAALSDACIDLCYGYLETEDLEKARWYGEKGLSLAESPRQIRNAHYLLGEAAYQSGDTAAAEEHFDELARFYPEFRNLKRVLYALDLRSMINLKL